MALPAVAILAVIAAATALATDPALSFWGSHGRSQGAVTLVCLPLLTLLVATRLAGTVGAQRAVLGSERHGVSARGVRRSPVPRARSARGADRRADPALRDLGALQLSRRLPGDARAADTDLANSGKTARAQVAGDGVGFGSPGRRRGHPGACRSHLPPSWATICWVGLRRRPPASGSRTKHHRARDGVEL